MDDSSRIVVVVQCVHVCIFYLGIRELSVWSFHIVCCKQISDRAGQMAGILAGLWGSEGTAKKRAKRGDKLLEALLIAQKKAANKSGKSGDQLHCQGISPYSA